MPPTYPLATLPSEADVRELRMRDTACLSGRRKKLCTTHGKLVPIAAAALLLLALQGCASVREPALPTYEVRRAAGPITIDGRLDEPSWRAAVEVGPFTFPWWESGPKEQTIVKLLWDDGRLYLAYFCLDRHIAAFETKRDAKVYRDDTVEAFIAPDAAHPKRYINFEINCLGTILDGRPGAGAKAKYDAAGIQAAGLIDGTLNDDTDTDYAWTMEVAIPFADLACYAPRTPPQPGDTWRLGLNRCGGVTNEQYSQWSNSLRPKPAFHVPNRFGIITFSNKPARTSQRSD